MTTFKTFPKNAIDPEAKIITDPKEMIGKRTPTRPATLLFFERLRSSGEDADLHR
ncbi:MAG: hypothetical protein U0792_04525 [Gemmataceae bacterium]